MILCASTRHVKKKINEGHIFRIGENVVEIDILRAKITISDHTKITKIPVTERL